MGKERKIPTKDEFLSTWMKLRLDLQTRDLRNRFDVSEGLCFESWLRKMTEYLKAFAFISDLETILATTFNRFCQFRNLFGIIVGSKVFIATPRNLKLQSVTSSEYKHHNTINFLVCVAPN